MRESSTARAGTAGNWPREAWLNGHWPWRALASEGSAPGGLGPGGHWPQGARPRNFRPWRAVSRGVPGERGTAGGSKAHGGRKEACRRAGAESWSSTCRAGGGCVASHTAALPLGSRDPLRCAAFPAGARVSGHTGRGKERGGTDARAWRRHEGGRLAPGRPSLSTARVDEVLRTPAPQVGPFLRYCKSW